MVAVSVGVPLLATAAIAGGPISSVMSYQQQRSAAADQRQASRLEQRRAALQNARERRRAVAASQIQASQQQALSAAQTTGGSTGSQNIQSAIMNQTAGNVAFQQGQEGLYSSIISSQNRANRSLSRANMYQTLGQIPQQLGVPTPGQLLNFAGRSQAGQTTRGTQ